MDHNLKVGRIAGIEIDLHYTWFIVLALLSFGLAVGFFPERYPGLTSIQYWVIGIIAAILLFVSVLIHELSHSLVAKHFNIAVDKITLFFFGGVASIGGENMTPKKEFWMAIAGPAVSLLLAGFFYFLMSSTSIIYVEAVSFYLFVLNLILGLFNLAPGFPLDGGRILRSLLWMYFKDVKKATKIAAEAGKVIAIIMIVWGFAGFFGFALEIYGILLGGIWFILLGFFLYILAGMSYEQIILKEILSKVKVKQVMKTKFISISPSTKLSSLFQKYFLGFNQESFLVTKDNKLLGYVNIDSLQKIPQKTWSKVSVKSIMVPAKNIPSTTPDDNAFHVLLLLSKQKLDILPVIKNKKLVGSVDVVSLVRYVRFHSK